MICSNALGDGCSRLEDEVEDKEGFCEACGNNRIIFELTMEEKRSDLLIRGPLPRYQQVDLDLLLGNSSTFDDPPTDEKVRSGS